MSKRRTLAGLLFEFLVPGHRHASSPSSGNGVCLPLRVGDKFLSKDLLKRFRQEYRRKHFLRYVEAGQFTHVHHRDGDNPFTATPFDVPWDAIASELRRVSAVIDWYHQGVNGVWLSNHRHRRAAQLWLIANDEVRRRALVETQHHFNTGSCDFVKAMVDALGVDYKMRTEKRFHRVAWLCEQTFLDEKQQHKNQGQNFNLTRADAVYLIRLYDLRLPRGVDPSVLRRWCLTAAPHKGGWLKHAPQHARAAKETKGDSVSHCPVSREDGHNSDSDSSRLLLLPPIAHSSLVEER